MESVSPQANLTSSNSQATNTSSRLSISQNRDAAGWRGQSDLGVCETSKVNESPPDLESRSRRFACDTNPVVTLLDDPDSRLQKGKSLRGNVGGWYDDRISGESPSDSDLIPNSAALLPPDASQEVLVNIFFSRIHPILPLLDKEDTLERFKNRTLYLPILQAICLVAAKDRHAVPFLRLGSNGELLPLELFSQRLHQATLKNIPSRQNGKRIAVIQILALLALHEWGPSGSEDSSLSLSQAIHHAQTIGLHLRRPDKESDLQLKAIFWTLWSLDRWNSAIHGRPIIIHDCDLGQNVLDIIPIFEPPFRLWLHLANTLTQVIRSYRPVLESNHDSRLEIPTFEELVNTSDAWVASSDVLSKFCLSRS